MNSSAVDIKAMLEADSNVEIDSATSTYPIVIGQLPTEPNNIIMIRDTMGIPDGLTLEKTERYKYDAVQVYVRSNSYLDAWALINSINESLHGRANETWNGTFYALIKNEGGPGLLDYNENQRVRLVCNFSIQRR